MIKNLNEYCKNIEKICQKAKDEKMHGHKIAGYFCAYTPLEILDAAGYKCVRLCCIDNEHILAAESDLPKNLCPLIKSSYGATLMNEGSYLEWADIIIGETTCDGKKKMYDLLGKKKKMYVLQIPQGTKLDYSRKLWLSEINKFINFMEQESEIKISDEAIRAAANKRNELRLAVSELMKAMKKPNVPISGLELYRLLEWSYYNTNIEESIFVTKALVEELCAKPTSIPDKKHRILITGCPIGGVLDKVVGTIERNGGSVVCYENCFGFKTVNSIIDTGRENIKEAIADAYLEIGCSVMTPNKKRIENLCSLIDEFRIEGVVDVTLQTCTTYMIETYTVRNKCNELGIPYMSMETDYSHEDRGQLETRISAFLETLC